MKNLWSHVRMEILIGLLLAVILLAGAAAHDLRSGDETRQAGIAAGMLLERDWVVPRLNGSPFLEYPPLHAWSTAAAFALFGFRALAAKLPSLLAAAGILLLTWKLGRKIGLAGWQSALSAFFLLTGAQFFVESRNCRVDMLLAFCIMLTLTAFYCLTHADSLRNRAGWWGAFALGLTGGIAAKGLIGGAVSAVVIGGWLVATDVASRQWHFRRYLAALTGGAAALALIAVWYFAIWRIGGEAMLKIALYDNNLGRFLHPTADHAEPCWYYLVKLPELFQPWLLLLAAALWLLIRQGRIKHDEGLQFLLAGALLPLLLLSCASAKRIVYLLPVFPFWALLCGAALTEVPARLRQWWTPRRQIAALLLLTAVAVVADCAVGMRHRRSDSLAPLFAAARDSGKAVLLSAPLERTCGAAVFYLHHRVPVAPGNVLLPPPGTCLIRRSREPIIGGIPFNDCHYLIFAPGEGL